MFLKKKNFGSSAYDFLIVGLGNPGKEYEHTRHNIGFMAVDRLAEKYKCEFKKTKFDALSAECKMGNKRIFILKPLTFMNLSGKSVKGISDFYKITSDKIVVLFDDISLDVGNIRMRRKGSDGGHNGIKNIISFMNTNEIMRIKLGVGSKPHAEYDLKDWVLGKFSNELQIPLNEALDKAVLAVEEILEKGMDSAMNKYNS